MRIGALDPTTPPGAAADAPGAAAEPGKRFSAILQQQLHEPRDRIEAARASVRAAIDDIRTGGPVLRRSVEAASAPSARGAVERGYAAYASYAGLAPTGGADPFGWRALTRRLGEDLVGPGFGEIFERQIQQESGYDPEVVFGFRRSSAGAEGIAQLMPQYYPGVDRTDPEASLLASAQTMRHYLTAQDGDVRQALASYNAGMGRVRALVDAHGVAWERGLPAETRQYLAAILGPEAPSMAVAASGEVAVFGGNGPGGVLVPPLDRVAEQRLAGTVLEQLGAPGATVRAPADGRVVSVDRHEGQATVRLDHGNGWTSTLAGLDGVTATAGGRVRRGEDVGTLPTAADTAALLRLAVSLDGRAVDPRRYLLRSS